MRYLRLLPIVPLAVIAFAVLGSNSPEDPPASDPPAMTIAMTSVFVDDPVAAFEFYTEVLGFQELQFIPEAQLAVVVSPAQPDGTALLLEPNQNPIASRFQEEIYESGIPVIVFGTNDMEAEYRRLTERGVVFYREPTETPFGVIADFDDTFGNLIRLAQL